MLKAILLSAALAVTPAGSVSGQDICRTLDMEIANVRMNHAREYVRVHTIRPEHNDAIGDALRIPSEYRDDEGSIQGQFYIIWAGPMSDTSGEMMWRPWRLVVLFNERGCGVGNGLFRPPVVDGFVEDATHVEDYAPRLQPDGRPQPHNMSEERGV